MPEVNSYLEIIIKWYYRVIIFNIITFLNFFFITFIFWYLNSLLEAVALELDTLWVTY